MEPVHIGLCVLIAILLFAFAINYFDRRLKSEPLGQPAEGTRTLKRASDKPAKR
ncbi:hypothetical protein NVV93_02835 [Pseudomonas sp. LS44]|uniref:hypothetical protein n=1 Tax=Pseudomonas sp. LS44 TaxID=1357074 RepID=UPI00215AF3C5|nr:hypothetical protein [Pseudomonas sp. LS44]UVE18355.1 hypothetical protein NVV93_02835 [Pseudomonas sp. LS44]